MLSKSGEYAEKTFSSLCVSLELKKKKKKTTQVDYFKEKGTLIEYFSYHFKKNDRSPNSLAKNHSRPVSTLKGSVI